MDKLDSKWVGEKGREKWLGDSRVKNWSQRERERFCLFSSLLCHSPCSCLKTSTTKSSVFFRAVAVHLQHLASTLFLFLFGVRGYVLLNVHEDHVTRLRGGERVSLLRFNQLKNTRRFIGITVLPRTGGRERLSVCQLKQLRASEASFWWKV